MIELPFKKRALIGMIHLPALPGAPDACEDLRQIAQSAALEAQILKDSGFDAIMIENFFDAPFFKDDVPAVTVASLTRCALAVRQAVPDLPLGINVLRNDGCSALAIAIAVDAQFIRVNVLTGAMVTDQGIIEGCAAPLLRQRKALQAPIAILADVDVKHAAPLAPLDPAQSARDTLYRGHADALIVSGTGTGQPTDPATLAAVQSAVPQAKVLIGSGITAENLHLFDAYAFIVGTALKENGKLSAKRCQTIRRKADEIFGSH